MFRSSFLPLFNHYINIRRQVQVTNRRLTFSSFMLFHLGILMIEHSIQHVVHNRCGLCTFHIASSKVVLSRTLRYISTLHKYPQGLILLHRIRRCQKNACLLNMITEIQDFKISQDFIVTIPFKIINSDFFLF
jgi:hypothetical protein